MKEKTITHLNESLETVKKLNVELVLRLQESNAANKDINDCESEQSQSDKEVTADSSPPHDNIDNRRKNDLAGDNDDRKQGDMEENDADREENEKENEQRKDCRFLHSCNHWKRGNCRYHHPQTYHEYLDSTLEIKGGGNCGGIDDKNRDRGLENRREEIPCNFRERCKFWKLGKCRYYHSQK